MIRSIYKVSFLIIFTLLLTTLFFAIDSYIDPAGYPAAWPDSEWIPYTYFAELIEDEEGSDDLSTGGTTPTGPVDVTGTATIASFSYFGNNGVLFLRVILAGDPITNNGLYYSYTWNFIIDTDGDGYKEFVVLLNGPDKGADPDDIEIYYSDSESQSYNDTDLIWSQDSAVGSNNNVDGEIGSASDFDLDPAVAILDFGRTRVTDLGNSMFALDMQIPIAALDASAFGGPTICESSRMAFAFSSSSSNVDPTQKDFVFPGAYTMEDDEPLPFGDVTTGDGDISQDPYFVPGEMTVSGCGVDSFISSNVIDTTEVTTSGEVISSVQSVEYYYYFDRNNNSLADDGMEWIFIGNATLIGNLNPWSFYGWDTTGLFRGQYIIKGIATDKQGNITDSYDQYTDGDCRVIALLNNSCGIPLMSLSGKVFLDFDSDGGAYFNGIDVPATGVNLRLYREIDSIDGLTTDDNFVDQTSTDGNGDYTFSFLEAGRYYVVADSKSVSGDLNSGYIQKNVWAEQTYLKERISGSYVETNLFGGEDPLVSDFFELADTAIASSAYEHQAVVDLDSIVSGIDFGFSFDVVINHTDTGNNTDEFESNQGTLRQFILNSNAISGSNTASFVMATTQNETIGSNSWWRIDLQSALPEIVDAGTAISGTVYDNSGNIVNSNLSTFGGGSVGTDNKILVPFQGTEIEINLNDFIYGLKSSAANFVLQNISLYNGGGVLGDSSATIQLSGDYILENIISGVRADGSLPADDEKNKRYGISLSGSGELSHVYTGYCSSGILIETVEATLTQSRIEGNAAGVAGIDGNGLTIINGKMNIYETLINSNGGNHSALENGNGIFYEDSNGGLIKDSSIEGSTSSGISIKDSNNLGIILCEISGSVFGAGITLDSGSVSNDFSRNKFGNNKGVAIDLDNDGITLNDGLLNPLSANNGLDKPVIEEASIEGNILTLSGYVGATSPNPLFSTAILEFYSALAGEGDNSLSEGFGEGLEYISYLTVEADGTFSGTIDMGEAEYEYITAITRLNQDTSEFGKNTQLTRIFKISGYVYEDRNLNKTMDALELGIENVRVELWKYESGSWSENNSLLTDENGYFSLTAEEGIYRVVEDSDNSYSDAFNGADPTGYISTSSNSVEVNVDDNCRIDFGDFPGFEVKGFVFDDSGDGSSGSINANNGIMDSEENGIGNVRVTLINGVKTYTRITDENGEFNFTIFEDPVYPIVLSETDLSGYTSTGDKDSNGTSSFSERNTVSIDFLDGSLFNFGDVKKLNIKGTNNLSVSPGEQAVLFHNLVIGTPGSVEFSVDSSMGYSYFVYKLTSSGSLDESWDTTEVLATGIYPFAVVMNIPVEVPEGTLNMVTIRAVQDWSNSSGVDSASAIDAIYISNGNLKIDKQVRNYSSGEGFRVVTDAKPGELLEYKIIFDNAGEFPLSNLTIIDPIDGNTTFQKNVFPVSFDVLLNLNGTTQYLKAEDGLDINGDGAHISGARLYMQYGDSIGIFEAGESGYIIYRVKVNE